MDLQRPRLLVSVRDAWEAEEALAGGADWIDLKEPRRGALGAVTADVARNVVECVGARAPLSAAAGELADWATASSRELLDVPGITHLKLGLADCGGQPWETWWRAAQKEATAAGKDLVAAAYADHVAALAPSPADVVTCAASAGARWLLADTFDKSGGALCDHWPRDELADFIRLARSAGLYTVLAGGLTRDAIAQLPLELVDMAAVRGAACDGPREAKVCRMRVADLVLTLSTGSTAACANGV
jgi:uncharacterized protein (UPF0264 family)